MKLLVILLSASALLAAAPAAAQQPPVRPERPYRGLFAGGVDDFQQLLTLNMSLGGGYSDNVLKNQPSTDGVEPPPQSHSSGFGNMSGHLAYSLNRTRVGVNAGFGSWGSYYPVAQQNFNASYHGSVVAFLQPARSTRIDASHVTTYEPFVTLNTLPDPLQFWGGQPVFPEQEFGTIQADYLNHTSGVSLTQDVFRHVGLTMFYARHASDFGGFKRVFSNYGGGTRFNFPLARGLGLRFGYAYTRSMYDEDGNRAYHGHNLDGGVDFNRAISFSRRTTLSFGTGASAISDGRRSQYRMTGQARLNHDIGRTWYASAGYARTAGFLETLSAPVFSDSVTLGFGGLVNRRVAFQSGATASSGEFVLGSGGDGFHSYRASAGFTFGLTRHLALGTNYSYYRYSFDQGGSLPAGFPREMDRQSVRAFLSLWVPLMYRARRPDATR